MNSGQLFGAVRCSFEKGKFAIETTRWYIVVVLSSAFLKNSFFRKVILL